ncbi:hypothetical protein CLV98_101275 [Dyadobacter jejuensis]|uniref:AhpC/TSA family protein n=2 Tax=Dyadobacter jejuensis TaxID=1082580 RepID=A0A316AS05_9BACT|nr:hypothetical protein CLV98_101275 [Dyadobacter jejuensis]
MASHYSKVLEPRTAMRITWLLLLFTLWLQPSTLWAQEPTHTAPSKLRVLLFLDPECPITQSYMREIRNLIADYEPKGVTFEAIFPTYTVTDAEIKKFFVKYKVPLKGRTDPAHITTKRYGATTMPEVVLVSGIGQTLYQGAIDNWYYALGKNRPKATAAYLRNALEAGLQGAPILVRKTEAIGCLINE